MDVLRGFALLGIALMNVEFFNRSGMELGTGLPATDTGAAHVAGWLVAWLVTGKFWVLFSLLFGMGFAVMLQRAQARGGDFLRTYRRRTLALLGFGLGHAIGLWMGDILVGYAVTAAILLLVWFGSMRRAAMLALVVLVVAAIPGLHGAAGLVALIALAMIVGDWIRAPEGRTPRGLWALAALGMLLLAAGIALVALGRPMHGGPVGSIGALLGVLAWLAARYRGAPAQRPLRVGVALYLLVPMSMLVGAIVVGLDPQAMQPSNAEARQAQAESVRDYQAAMEADVRALRSPAYADDVQARLRIFPESLSMLPILGTMALGVFLVGGWLLTSGAIADPQAHARFWHRLRMAWPLCAAVVAFALWLAPGMPRDAPPQSRQLLGAALAMAAALPMALGYIAMILRGLRTQPGARLLSLLAPAGRMALTNYLMQSLICGFVFYGWGLHQWGMARHWQVVLVFAMYAAQVLFSIAWLRVFRYGPMEWLWRWLTYGRRPVAQPAMA